MAKYKLIVPNGAKDFQFGQKTYSAGSEYETDDPCEAKSFYNAAKTTNPDIGREDQTKGFWKNVDARCSAQPAANPAPAPVTPPQDVDPSPSGGDSPDKQGAPKKPDPGNVEGTTITPPDEAAPDPVPTEEPRRPPAGDPHPTHGDEKPQIQTNAGDPVDIFSGSLYLHETDMVIPNTIFPLFFTRFYRSGPASFGPFGWNWDHNFNLFIRELNTGDIALWRNLREEIFKFNGTGFEPQRGVFQKLDRIPALSQVYELTDEGGVVLHFERPTNWTDGERIPLIRMSDRHGNELQFTYDTENRPAQVTDDDNRFFKFEYDACGLLVAVSDHAGRKFIYEHDEETMQLVSVKSPPVSDHPAGITRIYHYEVPWALPDLRHNIVRVEDSEGNIYLENTYDHDPSSWSFARITEQLFGGFLYQFQYTQLQWVPSDPVFINIPALRVEVMKPDYCLETYTFNYRGDLLDRRYRLSKDKSYRVVVWQYEFDAQGNLSKTTKPDGSEEIKIFDFANPDPRMRGKLLQREITSASGFPAPSRIVWKGKYEPAYQLLIEERNETGAITTYKFDFNITPAALNNSGKLIEIIQPDATLPDGTVQNAKTIFEYNGKGQITALVLPDGTRNEITYGTTGEEKSRPVNQFFDAGGLNVQKILKYDNLGFNNETIDGNGSTTILVFNALGLNEKSILPAVNGLVAENIFHYDSDKKLLLTEKPRGAYSDPVFTITHIQDHFERDVSGNLVKYTSGINTSEARVVKFKNDYRGFPVETIYPDGSIIRKTFDERGLQLNEEITGTDGTKITWSKTYDRSGKLIHETNLSGVKKKYEYDGFSRNSKVILANGTEVKSKWIRNDLLESEEVIGDDGNGTVRQLSFRSFSYDEKNRKVTETIRAFADNPAVFTNDITTIFYDNSDRVVKRVNTRGGISAKQYDALGRVTIESDPLGNEEHFTYDNNGNILQTNSHHKEPDGSVSVFTRMNTFDPRDRRIELIEPDGSKITNEYDDNNLLIKQTDYLGVIKEMFYNSYGNKIREINDSGGLNIQHQWIFDTMSRIISYIDPAGQVSDYSYDSIGRNYKVAYPNGFSSNKNFNNNNQVVSEQLGSGVEFTYTYDPSNRLSKIENIIFPVPLVQVEANEFRYDGLNRLVEAKSGADIILRKYDSQDRLLAETTLGSTISCTYDDTSGEIHRIWPDGRAEKLTYDLNGIVSKIEEEAGGLLGSGNTPLAVFKPSGPNIFGEAEYPGGLNISNTYDERKRLTEIVIQGPPATAENIKYRYNSAGIKQVEALLGQNPVINYYEFDDQYRLLNARNGFSSTILPAATQADHDLAINAVRASAAAASHQENFIYNPSDDRIKYSETGLPDKDYTFLPGHRIQSDGTNTYSYHDDGTLKTAGNLTYEADALGRIVRIISGAGIIVEIKYDAFGRPFILKETGKPDISFNYMGGFIFQENENGIASRQITIHPYTGVPVAYHSGAGTHYPLFDNRYNLIGILDSTGNLIETFRYKSFGLPQVFDSNGTVISSSSIGVQPVFGGQRYLDAPGLYLSKRRLMNPGDGTFLSGDPKGYIDSSSLYVYVAQNPIDFADPTGEDKEVESGNDFSDIVRNTLTGLNPIVEGTIWNPKVWGNLTRAEQLAINARRGVWLEYFAGNNLGRFFPKADKLTVNAVVQIKSIFTNSASYVQRVVRGATRDAATALARNSNWAGRFPQAEILFRTGTPSELVDAARGALAGGRRIPSNALPPNVVVGLPGKLGTTLKWAGRFGGGLSLYAFYNDIAEGDVIGGIGSGSSSASFLLAEMGLLPAAAVVGSFSIGWEIGRFIDEKTGWGESLTDRAVRNREIYKDLGLGDTASTILGAPATIPIVSEVGEGIGWGAFKVYQGGSFVANEVQDFVETRDWGKTFRPWRWFD